MMMRQRSSNVGCFSVLLIIQWFPLLILAQDDHRDDHSTAECTETTISSSRKPVNIHADTTEGPEPNTIPETNHEKSKSCISKFDKCPGSPEEAHDTMAASVANLVALEFEIFGKVQGVFFRKYTANKGKELGLRGWCQNTLQGTVVGEVEGPPSKVNQMKEWLARQGSPKSQISKADFRNERNIDKHKYSNFDVRK